jgi:Helix-turn-helix domain
MTTLPVDTTEVLTIEEAAALLRIGRNAAYAAARQWRCTDGREGLPCIELGRTLRVPVSALRDYLDRARLVGDTADDEHTEPPR